MRTITHGDVAAAARALAPLSPATRRGAAWALLERAHAADLFRKRFGRAHPLWGNGSLMAAALARGCAEREPLLADPAYLEAMATVIVAVLDWRHSRRVD